MCLLCIVRFAFHTGGVVGQRALTYFVALSYLACCARFLLGSSGLASRAVLGIVEFVASRAFCLRTPSPSRHCRPLKAALSCSHTSAWRAAVLTSHPSGRLRRRLIPALGALQTMSPVEEFLGISNAATARLADTFNAPDVVPFGSAALDLIARHPEEREAFAQCLISSALDPEHYDAWFVQFCVHGLRWTELKSAFEAMHSNAVARSDWTKIPYLAKVLAAFEEDWEDARDFYGAYFVRGRA